VTLTRRAADYSGGADFLLLGPAGRLRKGSAYALVVWLLNAAVVLPATGDGFAGSAHLSLADMIWFAGAHTLFFVLLAGLYGRLKRRSMR
jgi:hypothetical protein